MNETPETVKKKLEDVLKSEYRASTLNKRVHFLLLDVNFLRQTLLHNLDFSLSKQNSSGTGMFSGLGSRVRAGAEEDTPTTSPKYAQSIRTEALKDINDLSNSLSRYILLKHSNTVGVNEVLDKNFNLTTKILPLAVLDGNKTVVGVFYSSFGSTYNGIFKDFLNKYLTGLLSQEAYITRASEKLSDGSTIGAIRKVYDVGHLVSSDDKSVTSPAIYKINALIDTITKTISEIEITQSGSPKLNILRDRLNEINQEKQELISRSGYGNFAIKFLKDFKYTTGSGNLLSALNSLEAVVVFPQDALENRYLYGTKVEGKAISSIKKFLSWINFSRNIVEEVPHIIGLALTGKAYQSTTTKVKVIGKLPLPKPVVVTTSKAKSGTTKRRPTFSKNTGNQAYSLANLQILINTHLQDVVSANMGAGGSKGLLNYRTGRFAASVNLERLTISREGMISAFYTYMKNPYQTFDPGFAQGSPATRSPKLLISRSIKEIAATKVHNRMRTILV